MVVNGQFWARKFIKVLVVNWNGKVCSCVFEVRQGNERKGEGGEGGVRGRERGRGGGARSRGSGKWCTLYLRFKAAGNQANKRININ